MKIVKDKYLVTKHILIYSCCLYSVNRVNNGISKYQKVHHLRWYMITYPACPLESYDIIALVVTIVLVKRVKSICSFVRELFPKTFIE